MSNEIIKILDYLGEKLGVVVDWTSETALPYAQEVLERFVNYKIGCCVAAIVIGVLCIVVIFILANSIKAAEKRCIQTKKDNWFYSCHSYYGGDFITYTDVGFSVFVALIVVLSIVGIACLLAGSIYLCKWCFIPEMQLLQYLNHMI